MTESENNTVIDRCKHSRTLAREIEQLMPTVGPCCRRHDLAACTIDLALEHHRALVALVEARDVGAAAALIRPLLEASTSAFWFVYAASDQQVLALSINPSEETPEHDIPTLKPMLDALKSYFPAISSLAEALASKGSRTALWLHKYTHGGTPQLIHRDRVSGWREKEVLLALLRADMFTVLGASVATVRANKEDFRRYIFGQRDALAAELTRRFGVTIPHGQPQIHPIPDKHCCGEPLFAAK